MSVWSPAHGGPYVRFADACMELVRLVGVQVDDERVNMRLPDGILYAFSVLEGLGRSTSEDGGAGRRADVLRNRFRESGLVALLSVASLGCAQEYRDVGSYRIVTATDGFFGLFCQPRTEFYFLDPSASGSDPIYLGTCGTPAFVTKHLGMPGDPSCFAASEDGSSLVYLHRPELCGGGEKAKRKTGGVHLHSASDGDRLLYRSADEVSQVWSGAEIGPGSIRVSWIGATPSRNGAVCPQILLIHADGGETPEGEPGKPDSSCK